MIWPFMALIALNGNLVSYQGNRLGVKMSRGGFHFQIKGDLLICDISTRPFPH